MLDEFRERKLEVIGALSALSDVASALGARGLARRLDTEIVRKLEADRFHLVVVGEFNHGKTTLVNAMLGASVLPVGVTPTTAVIHHVVHSDAPRACVVTDGESRDLPFERVAAYAADGEGSRDPVRYLEIGYPAEFLRERIVLVDTPGVNDLSLTRAEITFDYIPRSDAVLFVLDAGQPVKESERQFLETQLIGRSREKIVFVVAKSDIWSADERREALSYIESRVHRLLPDAPVFPVSAIALLNGNREASGLAELEAHLGRFLAEQRGRIVLGNAARDGLQATDVLSRAVGARRRAASLTLEQLSARVALLERDLAGHEETVDKRRLMIREEAGAIKAWARRDLDRFCDDVVVALPAALDKVSGEDVRKHLGAFLDHSFRDWAAAETREIGAALESLAERTVALVQRDSDVVGERLGAAMGSDLSAPKIEVDTFAQDVGVFAMMSLGFGMLFGNMLLGGLLLAGAPALALYNRDRTEKLVRRRALEVAPVVLRETAAKVAPKIDEMVEEFAGRLDAWVVEASQELFREVIEVLQSVREKRQNAEPGLESEEATCQTLSGRIEEVRARLVGLLEPKREQAQSGEGSR